MIPFARMHSRKTGLLFALIAGILLLIGLSMYFSSQKSVANIIVLAGQALHVDVAATDAARAKGLGGRTSLGEGEGMLFVFPVDGDWGFWMKDMRFPIDILWLSSQKEVVYIAPSVSPETYPSVFHADKPARYVLEVPAGWTEAHKVGVGDVARW